MDMTASLEALIASGKDGAPVRFALASRYAANGEIERALEHAEIAVAIDADYSAAWKLLGKLRGQTGRRTQAIEAYRRGIAVAQKRGDQQAVREMQVFLKRLLREQSEQQ